MGKPDLEGDATRVLDVIEDGGVAIVPLSVAYAIIGRTEPAIRRIFKAKQRSYEKPSGMLSNFALLNEILLSGEREREVVRTVIEEHDLPMSAVAPFRADHPLIQGLAPFVRENSTKAGTLDMLLNAGAFHNEIVRQASARGIAVVGSSANTSLTGSKFTAGTVDEPVLAAADIVIDHGQVKYHNPEGRSSSIIDLRTFKTVRIGVCYDKICAILRERFDIDLKAIGMV